MQDRQQSVAPDSAAVREASALPYGFSWSDAALLLGAAIFYCGTMTQTAYWSDPAQLENRAMEGWELSIDARRYPLYTILLRLLVLPFAAARNVAFWSNALTALFGAAAVFVLYRLALTLGAKRGAAAAGALSFMVAHTVWQQTAFTEVYSLSNFLILTTLASIVLWRRERQGWLYFSLFCFGLGFFQHRFHLLVVPPYLLYLWLKRDQLARPNFVWGPLCFLVGLLPLAVLALSYLRDHSLSETIHVYLFSTGKDWADPITGVEVSRFTEDLFYLVGFFGYNFFGLALPLGLVGLARSFRTVPREAWLLGGFMATSLAFGFDYNIGEKWIFFIPMYIVFAVWVALGAEWLLARFAARRPALTGALLALLIAVPLFTYWLAPQALNRFNLNPFKVADAAEYNRLFFFPYLRSDDRPVRHAQRVFSVVPPGSHLMADYATYQVLLYFQTTHGMGQGVQLDFLGHLEQPVIDQDLAKLRDGRPIYLALWPYYELYAGKDALRIAERIDQTEPVYRVFDQPPAQGETAAAPN